MDPPDDKKWLDKAYESPDDMSYDQFSGTLYLAGTKRKEDMWANAAILTGTLGRTERYKFAKHIFETLRPHRVVGHSLGAAIAEKIAQTHSTAPVEFVLYGAPRVSGRHETDPRIISYNHYGDPISMFDQAAITTPVLRNPHTYP